MKRSLLFCALVAVAYSLLVNAGTLVALAEHRATPVQMGIDAIQADEAHYFAMMETAAHGHWLLGSASLKEWRDSPGNVIFGPLLQAAVLRVTHLPLGSVIWTGDLLLPALVFFVLCLILLTFFGTWEAIAVAVLLMNMTGIGWLRSVSPQTTVLFITVYLWMFITHGTRMRLALLRGALIALLCFVQIQMALYCVAAEALLMVVLLIRYPQAWKKTVVRTSVVALPVLVAVTVQWLLQSNADPLALADTRRRFGLIDSRLPAAPDLQLILLLAGITLAAAMRFSAAPRAEMGKIGILILAGLLVLNQSVIHGKDAIFGLYYHLPLMIIAVAALWIAAASLASRYHRLLHLTLALSVVVSLSSLMFDVVHINTAQKDASVAFQQSRVMDILASLSQESGEHVVLSPFELGNLVPVYTRDTVEMNRYSRFGIATDADLTQRFLLYRSLFPDSDPIISDPTHSLVLGQYAGNTAARKRTLCRILAKIRGENVDCTVTIRSQIYHQDLVALLDDRRMPDRKKLMRDFGVDRLILKASLPDDLRSICSLQHTVGDWNIYACRTAD